MSSYAWLAPVTDPPAGEIRAHSWPSVTRNNLGALHVAHLISFEPEEGCLDMCGWVVEGDIIGVRRKIGVPPPVK